MLHYVQQGFFFLGDYQNKDFLYFKIPHNYIIIISLLFRFYFPGYGAAVF